MPAVGDIIPKPDPEFDTWHRQYVNADTGAPNYPRTIGRLIAGLFQQAPVTMETAGTPSLTDDQLADLTDRGVKRGAAESVVFLRPALVNGQWCAAAVGASQVEATWAHDQLVEAIVWDVTKNGNDGYQMVTETYTVDSQTGQQNLVVQLWNVTKSPKGGWKLAGEVDTAAVDGVESPALHAQVRAINETPRGLFAWAWDFEDGRPVPVHYTNEHLITQLEDLHGVEHEDNQLPRNVVAVSQESMAVNGMDNPTNTTWGKVRGFIQGRNVLSVPSDQLAMHGTEAFIKHLRLEDDLVQRERIEMKEDVLYTACGISPTTMGRSATGRSDSGAAKRADNQLTLTTIAGPARRWAGTLTLLAAELARLQTGTKAGPVQVTEGLKSSAEERAELVAVQRGADVQSIEEGVKQINPDWDDTAVGDEVARIRNDNQLPTPGDM